MTDKEKPVGTAEVAEYCSVKPSTVETWRQTGRGPTYMRVGNRCLYYMLDVRKWLAAQRREPSVTMEEEEERMRRWDAAKDAETQARLNPEAAEETAEEKPRVKRSWDWPRT